MNKTLQNRFLILFTLKTMNYPASKAEVLNYLYNNKIIKLTEYDMQLLHTRNEERWRNELAFIRNHLVREGYVANNSKDTWEITKEGEKYLNELYSIFSRTENTTRINKETINYYQTISNNILHEEEATYGIKPQNIVTITEKSNIILSRVGQDFFRESLIRLYGKCCISGNDFINILVASHIKPWRFSNDKERLDKFNGLLLLPTYDKLFDLGYITFENSGNIKISDSLINRSHLGINENIKIHIFEESILYLEYHRNNVFLK